MKILLFDVFRSSDGGVSENAMSTKVYARIKLGMSNPSVIASARLYYGMSTVGFDNSAIANAVDIKDKFGLNSSSDLYKEKVIYIGDGYSVSTDYYFKLTFESSYGRNSNYDVLMRTAVPLFIHKNNYGVSVGQYSSASASYPKFESKWPAYLYGGVADFGDRWRELSCESEVSSPGDYGGGLLVARKIENRCIIKGSVMVTPKSTTMKLAALPDSSWWPGVEEGAVFSLNACQGRRIARIAVHGEDDTYPGYLCLEWVVNLSGGGLETSNNIWVQCSIEYWV